MSCLEMRQTALGANHPSIFLSMNDLAMLYYSQGKYKEAEPLYVSCFDS